MTAKTDYVALLATLSGRTDKSLTIKFLNFWKPKKLGFNLPKIQTKRPNLRILRQKDANGIVNSEDPDQTAPLGAV